MGRARPPVFAGNLQALTIPLRSPRAALNIVVLLSICRRNAAISTMACRRKLLQKYAIVNWKMVPEVRMPAPGAFLPRAWPPPNMPLSCGIMELSH
jgi:hypothetical protein